MNPFHQVAGDRLRVDRVIVVTFDVLRRGWPVVLPLVILLEWAPAGLQDTVTLYLAPVIGSSRYLAATIPLAAWFVFPLADIAVVMAALGVLGGKPLSLGGTLLAAVRLYPIVFVLDLLQNLVTLAEPWLPIPPLAGPWVAASALIVNVLYGLLSAALLLPSLAVAGEERLGVLATLRRCYALTRGDRLRVAVFAAFLMALQMVIAPWIETLLFDLLGRSQAAMWLALGPNALIFAFASASQASLYWELARLRDGAAPADVEQVFG